MKACGEVACVKKTDRRMCKGSYLKYEIIEDVLRIVHKETIAVIGAIGQSPHWMTSLAGSGIKMEQIVQVCLL